MGVFMRGNTLQANGSHFLALCKRNLKILIGQWVQSRGPADYTDSFGDRVWYELYGL